MDIEWVRLFTISMAIFALVEYILYFIKKRNPVVIAPILWIFLVAGYTVFKWIVDGDMRYYFASVIWNNVILVNGLILLVAALFIFKGLKPNGK